MGEGCGCSGGTHDDKMHEKYIENQTNVQREEPTTKKVQSGEVGSEKRATPKEDVAPLQ